MRRDAPNSEKTIREQVLGQQKTQTKRYENICSEKNRAQNWILWSSGRDTGITSIVHNTGNTSILPESSSIWNTGTDTGKY
jgi:hypothetical protein